MFSFAPLAGFLPSVSFQALLKMPPECTGVCLSLAEVLAPGSRTYASEPHGVLTAGLSSLLKTVHMATRIVVAEEQVSVSGLRV